MAPKDDPRENYRKGGIATVSVEAMLNLTNALAGYEPARRWHTSAFVRAGVITQFAEGSGSPLMALALRRPAV